MATTRWEMFRKVPISVASTPQDGLFNVVIDAWWQVTENDEILFHKPSGSPQCNHSQIIAARVRDRIHEGLEVRQLPIVYVPHHCYE